MLTSIRFFQFFVILFLSSSILYSLVSRFDINKLVDWKLIRITFVQRYIKLNVLIFGVFSFWQVFLFRSCAVVLWRLIDGYHDGWLQFSLLILFSCFFFSEPDHVQIWKTKCKVLRQRTGVSRRISDGCYKLGQKMNTVTCCKGKHCTFLHQNYNGHTI